MVANICYTANVRSLKVNERAAVNNPESRILLVDDDSGLTELLSQYLSESGCFAESVSTGEQALTRLGQRQDYDLVVLDVMMPGMSGLELLPMLRARWNMPVIMLTGRGEDIDRILGLEMGADDYLSKPCNPRELLARIKAVLRRVQNDGKGGSGEDLQQGAVILRRGSRRVEFDGQEVVLTTAEFDVLAELMTAAGKVVSRDHLTRAVLHRELSPYDRSIDVHVSRVRNALRQFSPDKELIVTIRGVGYQFVLD